ncbi:RING/U-box superfamily protein [Euphorbia peplus]|nr:RING/U-box superfamily protein [Euphorbia peplus]
MVRENMSVQILQISAKKSSEYPGNPSSLLFSFRLLYQIQQKVQCRTEDGRIINYPTRTTHESPENLFRSNLDIFKNNPQIFDSHLCHKLGVLGIDSRNHRSLVSVVMERIVKIIQATPNIQNQKVLALNLKFVSCKTYLVGEMELMSGVSRMEFARQNYGMVPATKEAIDMIVNSEKVVTEKENCGVCLEEVGEIGVGMPCCDHVFHKNCIQKWLTISHTCPLCRSELPVQSLNALV